MSSEKDQLIDHLQRERASFERIMSGLTEEQMVQYEFVDQWTFKDILAHITAWEVELLRWLEQASRGKSPGIPAPGEWWPFIEKFNNQTYLENRDRSLESVLNSFDQVYEQVLSEFMALPDDEEDSYWSAWFGGNPPWILFATYHEHYKEHGAQIESRLVGDD